MAEIQQVASSSLSSARQRTAVRPYLPHRPHHKPRLRVPLEETQSLKPAVPRRTAASSFPVLPPWPAEDDQAPWTEEPRTARKPPAAAPRFPPRTRGEWLLMAILLLGLVLNAAVLLIQPGLSRSDVALGTTVLGAGVVLLALMELCRSQPKR